VFGKKEVKDALKLTKPITPAQIFAGRLSGAIRRANMSDANHR
jgi:hypothetical protein